MLWQSLNVKICDRDVSYGIPGEFVITSLPTTAYSQYRLCFELANNIDPKSVYCGPGTLDFFE